MADGASRNVRIADWSLREEVARKVFYRFGTPDIDLMASQRSRKVPRFMSWNREDTEAEALDSMSLAVRWDTWELPYLFPPFSLIGKCLQKIREQEVKKIIMILPWSLDSTHLGTALSMSLRPPVKLRQSRTLVMDLVTGEPPAGWKERRLIACLLTGRPVVYPVPSQTEPNTSSNYLGDRGLSPPTDQTGGGGVNMLRNMEYRRLHLA